MKRFNSHNEIAEVFNSGKYNIFFEKDDLKYEVRHLGSTIYCYDPIHNLGRGAITNFDVEYFNAVEKPVPVQDSEPVDNQNEKFE